ncbi:Os01g0523000, partial [Oryza sativa Japonica Group]
SLPVDLRHRRCHPRPLLPSPVGGPDLASPPRAFAAVATSVLGGAHPSPPLAAVAQPLVAGRPDPPPGEADPPPASPDPPHQPPGRRLRRREPPLPSSPGVPARWLPRWGERGPRRRSPCGRLALPTSRLGGGKAKGRRREGKPAGRKD